MFSFEAVAAFPLLSPPAGGMPPAAGAALTTVEMVPSGFTSRMALLKVSAMNRSPAPSTATPCGSFSCAAVAGPPSPENPPRPSFALSAAKSPATVVMIPVLASTRRITLLDASAMYTSPAASTATPVGVFSAARFAGPPSPA